MKAKDDIDKTLNPESGITCPACGKELEPHQAEECLLAHFPSGKPTGVDIALPLRHYQELVKLVKKGE